VFDATLNYLFNTYPNTRDLASQIHGQFVMPLITEAGFAWRRLLGAARCGVKRDHSCYDSATKDSFGLQIGASNSQHVLS